MSYDSQHPYRPPDFTDKMYEAPRLKHTGFGIASFVIALVAGATVFSVILIAGVLETQLPGGLGPDGPAVMMVGFAFLAAMGLHLLGFGLGVGGIVQNDCKKVFAVLGLVFNSLVLIGSCGFLALGMTIAA